MTFQVTILFGLSFVNFLATILNSVGLFLLYQINWSFAYEFFGSHFELEL